MRQFPLYGCLPEKISKDLRVINNKDDVGDLINGIASLNLNREEVTKTTTTSITTAAPTIDDEKLKQYAKLIDAIHKKVNLMFKKSYLEQINNNNSNSGDKDNDALILLNNQVKYQQNLTVN
ncbi:17757_t:CDS:2 [Entrophospora sp. SA101]|nr:17757_t:CDS:2 [Entrophospora sp. SA101]